MRALRLLLWRLLLACVGVSVWVASTGSTAAEAGMAQELQRAILQHRVADALRLIASGAPQAASGPGGQTALMLAAYKGQTTVVSALIRHAPPHGGGGGGGVNAKHSGSFGRGRSALAYALVGWAEKNKLRHGLRTAAPELPEPADYAEDYTGVVRELVVAGADSTAAADDGGSPVLLAAKTRNERALELMLGAGQCVQDQALGRHVLKARVVLPEWPRGLGIISVIINEHASFHKIIATLLLKHGTPSNPTQEQQKEQQQQPTHHDSFGAWELRGGTRAAMLRAAVDAEAGETVPRVLLQVVREWTARLVGKVLAWCGPSLGKRLARSEGGSKQTAFHLAAAAGDNETLGVLLGVSPQHNSKRLLARTTRGLTPLHLSAIGGHMDAAALLLRHGQAPAGASASPGPGPGLVRDMLTGVDVQGRRPADVALTPAIRSMLTPAPRPNQDPAASAEAAAQGGADAGACAAVGAGSGSHGDGACAASGAFEEGAGDAGCDLPTALAASLSAKDFTDNHLLLQRPVLIRGGAEKWPAMRKWNVPWFKEKHGQHPVRTGAIPFAAQYGYNETATTLGRFIDEHMQGPSASAGAGAGREAGHRHRHRQYVFDTKLLTPESRLLADIKVPAWFAGMKMHPLSFMLGPVSCTAHLAPRTLLCMQRACRLALFAPCRGPALALALGLALAPGTAAGAPCAMCGGTWGLLSGGGAAPLSMLCMARPPSTPGCSSVGMEKQTNRRSTRLTLAARCRCVLCVARRGVAGPGGAAPRRISTCLRGTRSCLVPSGGVSCRRPRPCSARCRRRSGPVARRGARCACHPPPVSSPPASPWASSWGSRRGSAVLGARRVANKPDDCQGRMVTIRVQLRTHGSMFLALFSQAGGPAPVLQAHGLGCTQNPGDILFIPSGYSHAV